MCLTSESGYMAAILTPKTSRAEGLANRGRPYMGGENRIRPIALGRQNWLFAGSLRAGKRAAAVMSLIHSAKVNGLDPYAYLRDVLERLPTQPASRIAELLPHRWRPTT
jgi:hypothetical protein